MSPAPSGGSQEEARQLRAVMTKVNEDVELLQASISKVAEAEDQGAETVAALGDLVAQLARSDATELRGMPLPACAAGYLSTSLDVLTAYEELGAAIARQARESTDPAMLERAVAAVMDTITTSDAALEQAIATCGITVP